MSPDRDAVDRREGVHVQRWGSEQAPDGSVLLRTGALMSLASLGTAGLVLCGALALGGGPSGTTFPGALGGGPATVSAGEGEEPTVQAAAPAVRRQVAPAAAPRRARPAVRRQPAAPPVVGADDPLSGTFSSAAQTPVDLDSVAHPARAQVLLAPSSAPTAAALRGTPGGPLVAPQTPALAPQSRTVRAARTAAAPPTRAAQVAQAPEGAEAPGRTKAQKGVKAPKLPKAPKAAPVPKAAKAAKPAQLAKAPQPPRAAAVKAPKAPPVAKAPQAAQAPKAPKPPKPAKAPEAPQPAAPEPAAPASSAEEPAAHGHGKGEHPGGEPPGQTKGNGPKH